MTKLVAYVLDSNIVRCHDLKLLSHLAEQWYRKKNKELKFDFRKYTRIHADDTGLFMCVCTLQVNKGKLFSLIIVWNIICFILEDCWLVENIGEETMPWSIFNEDSSSFGKRATYIEAALYRDFLRNFQYITKDKCERVANISNFHMLKLVFLVSFTTLV